VDTAQPRIPDPARSPRLQLLLISVRGPAAIPNGPSRPGASPAAPPPLWRLPPERQIPGDTRARPAHHRCPPHLVPNERQMFKTSW
jgi:hypothetical protein